MATTIGPKPARLKDSPLGEKLTEEACTFGFFQAVTLLQRLSAAASPVGGFSNPEEESVHFRVNPAAGLSGQRDSEAGTF